VWKALPIKNNRTISLSVTQSPASGKETLRCILRCGPPDPECSSLLATSCELLSHDYDYFDLLGARKPSFSDL
jgi:hypothetical protein